MRNRAMSMMSLLVLAALLWSPGLAAEEGGIEFAGVIDAGLGLAAGEGLAFDDPKWRDGRIGFSLTAEARPAEGLRAYVELRLEEDLPAAAPSSLADLSSGLVSPSLAIVEAWASLQDAPIPGTELRLGRQRIAWGPADQIGIVDAFDVPDFSNLSAFGAKLASDALRLRYFGQRFGIDLAWTPFWRAAPLPETFPAAMMPSGGVAIPGMIVTPGPSVLETPENDAYESSTIGARFIIEPSLWTLGVSYVYGRSPSPAPIEVVVTPTATPGTLSAATTLAYPRRHLIGADIAGELLGIGVWAEGQYVIPERDYALDLTGLGQSRTTTPDEPYFRWLAGCDYTFANDMYINFQYLRGMGWENLPDSQNDWALLAFKWDLAGGAIVLGPLAAVLEIDALGDLMSGDREWADSYGVALSPSVTYKPYDGVELTVGMAWLLGAETSTLGSMAEESSLHFSTKISF